MRTPERTRVTSESRVSALPWMVIVTDPALPAERGLVEDTVNTSEPQAGLRHVAPRTYAPGVPPCTSTAYAPLCGSVQVPVPYVEQIVLPSGATTLVVRVLPGKSGLVARTSSWSAAAPLKR